MVLSLVKFSAKNCLKVSLTSGILRPYDNTTFFIILTCLVAWSLSPFSMSDCCICSVSVWTLLRSTEYMSPPIISLVIPFPEMLLSCDNKMYPCGILSKSLLLPMSISSSSSSSSSSPSSSSLLLSSLSSFATTVSIPSSSSAFKFWYSYSLIWNPLSIIWILGSLNGGYNNYYNYYEFNGKTKLVGLYMIDWMKSLVNIK